MKHRMYASYGVSFLCPWSLHMKKAGLVLGLLLFSCLSLRVSAKGLNEYEREVISEAKKTFELDGITYKAKDSYINALIEYLTNDVDLTGEQKDLVISKMYSSVKQGVTEGYLVPAEEDKGTDGTKEDNHGNDKEDLKETEETELDNGKKTDTSNTENKEDNKETKTPADMTEGGVKDIVEEVIASKKNKDKITVVDIDAGTVTVKDQEDDTVLVLNTVIKNTGFSLNITFTIITVLGGITMLAFIVTYKYKLLAHQDE